MTTYSDSALLKELDEGVDSQGQPANAFYHTRLKEMGRKDFEELLARQRKAAEVELLHKSSRR